MKCEYCPESFENHEALSRHIRKKHRNKIKFAVFEHPIRPKTKKEKRLGPECLPLATV